jgi:type I restriction enzyme, S subunit
MNDRILQRFIPSMPPGWKRVTIEQCLEEASKPISMRDSESYRLVSIRRRSGGMFHRGTLYGREILTKTLQEIVPRSFVIARMQIIHGAAALTSPEFEGAAISKSYSSFIGTPICDINFFSWLAKHPLMYAYYADASQGVVIEKMTFDQSRWLSYPIFLPPIVEQRSIARILDTIDEMIRSTEQLIAKREWARQGLIHGK